MTLFLLVGCTLGHGLRPRRQHPFPIIGMQHSPPPLALRLFLCETHIGEPLGVAEVQRAIGRATPDLLRNSVNRETQLVFASPLVLFRPLTLSNFLFQRLDLRFGLLEFGSFHHLPVSISSSDGKLVCA